MKLKKTIFTTGLLALIVGNMMAQSSSSPAPTPPKKELSRWSVGVNIGPMLSFSDIRQYDFWPVTSNKNEWGFGYGLNFSRSFNHVFSLQGYLSNGSVAGTKRKASLYFEAQIFEFGGAAVINFSNLTLKQSVKARKWAVYGVAGLGLSYFKTKLTQLYNSDSIVRQYGYSASGKGAKRTSEIVVPIGLGFKYKLNQKFDIGLESTQHFLNTDRLDATDIADTKDSYNYTCLTFTYKLGAQADENQWTNPLDILYADNAMIKSKIEGLTSDTDKDGVSDLFDKDNTTPDGVKVYGDGTTVDTDGDGVPDLKDSDPFSQRGAKVDVKGRELDTDNDGVADSRDLEPSTAAGALVNFQGKTINVSSITQTAEASSTGYLPSIYFATGSSLIQYKYYENLAAIAKVLKSNPSVKLTIVGNTDETGSDKINEVLGQKRAEAVADHLVRVYGIAKARLTSQSKGKSEPMAKGADGINRRVDFKVSK